MSTISLTRTLLTTPVHDTSPLSNINSVWSREFIIYVCNINDIMVLSMFELQFSSFLKPQFSNSLAISASNSSISGSLMSSIMSKSGGVDATSSSSKSMGSTFGGICVKSMFNFEAEDSPVVVTVVGVVSSGTEESSKVISSSATAAAVLALTGQFWSDQISSTLNPASYRVKAQWKKKFCQKIRSRSPPPNIGAKHSVSKIQSLHHQYSPFADLY